MAGRSWLLADPSVEPAVLTELAAAGVAFVTAVPPGRGDRWRRIGTRGLWTNAVSGPPADVLAAARRLPAMVTRLGEVLVEAGRALPDDSTSSADERLTRSVLLAVTASLGSLAWSLWGEREDGQDGGAIPATSPAMSVDPLLALERFADLSARVRVDHEQVLVLLPLGRRYADLLRGGLLAAVPEVPWLGGRIVRMEGG